MNPAFHSRKLKLFMSHNSVEMFVGNITLFKVFMHIISIAVLGSTQFKIFFPLTFTVGAIGAQTPGV